MEEEVEDVYNGMQTHVLVQKQLQDVILTQQAAYDKLKQGDTLRREHSLKIYKERSKREPRRNFFSQRVVIPWNALPEKVSNEHMVPSKQYEAVYLMLEEERATHSDTKTKLLEALDKLAFSEGEVEVLTRQIDREKMQFEQTFGLLKTKALTETVKNIELENKCHEIEKQCDERTDILSDKDLHIEALTRRLRTQKVHYERKLSELTIQMKQEAYIAQLLVDGSTHQKM